MTYELRKVGQTLNNEFSTVDPDILVAVPSPEYLDNVDMARANMEWQMNWVRSLGRKCGIVVVLSNHLAQDAETREIYGEGMMPELYYGIALVVGNPLSHAIGSFLVGLSKPEVPVKMVDSIDDGITWLQGIRKG